VTAESNVSGADALLYLTALRAAARCFGKSLLEEENRGDEESADDP